jgi:hypothetical protein
MRNLAKELPGGIRIDLSEAMFELDGVAVASEEVLEEAAKTLS